MPVPQLTSLRLLRVLVLSRRKIPMRVIHSPTCENLEQLPQRIPNPRRQFTGTLPLST
jgi:hypothetical protein